MFEGRNEGILSMIFFRKRGLHFLKGTEKVFDFQGKVTSSFLWKRGFLKKHFLANFIVKPQFLEVKFF